MQKQLFFFLAVLLFLAVFAGFASAQVCGNGTKEGTEECDANASNSDTIANACRTNCLKAHCGDGVLDSGEACDDGNIIDEALSVSTSCNGNCSGIISATAGLCYGVFEKILGASNAFGASVIEVFDSLGASTGFAVLGDNNTPSSFDYNAWLVKTDAAGNTCAINPSTQTCNVGVSSSQFAAAFSYAASYNDFGASVKQTFASGSPTGFAIAGASAKTSGSIPERLFFTRSSTTGVPICASPYLDPTLSILVYKSSGEGVVPIGSNYFVVAGYTGYGVEPTGAGTDVWLLKFSSICGMCAFTATNGNCTSAVTGTIAKTFGIVGADGGKDIVSDGGTGFAVTGYKGLDLWLLRVDSSLNSCSGGATDCSNATQFIKTFSGSGTEVGESLDKTPSDGGYIVAGYSNSFGSGDYNFYLVKTDTNGVSCSTGALCFTGSSRFVKTFGGSLDDKAYSVDQTSDGGYVIVGQTSSFGVAVPKLWVVKTDSSGNTCDFSATGKCFNGTSQFANVIDSPGGFGGAGLSVQQTLDGNYIVSGSTVGLLWLLRLDKFGHSAYECNKCGNAFFEPASTPPAGGEKCDDGNLLTTDFCGPDAANKCALTYCGDFVPQSKDGRGISEQCDDGSHCSDGTFCPPVISCSNNTSCNSNSDCGAGTDGKCLPRSPLCGAGTDGLCLPRSGGQCDSRCQMQFAGIKIVDIDLNSNTLLPKQNPEKYSALVDSSEIGASTLTVTIKNAATGAAVWSKSYAYTLLLGTQDINLMLKPDFSTLTLTDGGSYALTVKIEKGAFNDSKTVFFTIKSVKGGTTVAAVPEIGLFLVPLIAFAVVGLLLKKQH